MTDDRPRVVFLFEGNRDLHMFPSLDAAENWMEAIDVDAGEYTAAMTETGRIIKMSTDNGLVVLDLTDQTDLPRLQELLREHGKLTGQPGIDLDPIAFANQSWQHDWNTRWPKWPHWLDKRLHPHGPIQA